MSPDERIAALAARQHGAFTTAQAFAVGFTLHAITHRRRSGRWITLYRGVYAIAGAPRTEEQRIIAAAFSMGPHAVVASLGAAWLHGFVERPGTLVYVLLPSGQHRRARRGLVVAGATLSTTDVRTVNGIRVTSPDRTIVDLAAVLTRVALEAALDDAVQLGLTTVPTLRRYIDERRLGHRPGAKMLRELLDDRATGVSYKELEKMFMRKLRTAGLPEPVRQHPEGIYFIDIAYPDAMIAVELAGRAYHFSGRSFRADPRRRNDLVLAGWVLFEFTWEDIDSFWATTEVVLRRALGLPDCS